MDDPPLGPAAASPVLVPASTPRRRSRAAAVAIWLLGVALVLVLAAGGWLVVQYLAAQEQISDQRERIDEQEDQIEEQRELIDEKETFGAAMTGLLETAAKFDSLLTATIVPWHDYQVLADRAWAHRWDASEVSADTGRVELATQELEALWTTAQQEAGTNATGSGYEAVMDGLGSGFVRSVIDDSRCGMTGDLILGCVSGDDPYLVHFDASGDAEPFMNDELRTGIAYHEFAHVLQFTNPVPTEAALVAFGGDHEVMADCFALTYLDGWTLDHRIWVSASEYWDVSIGYGQACSEAQRQTIREWYGQLGVELQPIVAGGPGA